MLLVLAAALRAIVFAAYHPALIFPDSVRYLQYAHNFAGAHWSVDALRQSGYSVLIIPVLLLHDLWIIPLVQHLVGLVTAVLVYAVLIRFGVRTWLAAVATIPVLFDPLELVLEQYVLADTWTVFLVVAALAILVWRRERPQETHKENRGWLPAAACGLLLGVAVTFRGQELMLPHPGGRLSRLVRSLARPMELHLLQRLVPVRPGRGLRLLPGAEPARLRKAPVPYAAARAAQRGLLHLEPALTAVDIPSSGRHVQGRGGARLQPADTAPPAARLRRRGRLRLHLRVLAGTRGRVGALLTGVPAVPAIHPARPAGLRLDRRARLPGPRGPAGPGRIPDRLRNVVLPARSGFRGRARPGPRRPRHRPGPVPRQNRPLRRHAVRRQRGARAYPPGRVRHLRLALPASAAHPDPGCRDTRRGRDRPPTSFSPWRQSLAPTGRSSSSWRPG